MVVGITLEIDKMITQVGSKFRISQNRPELPPLCEGELVKYLGKQDGLDYWEAKVNVTFSPNNVHEESGELALDGKNVWMTIKPPGRMTNYTEGFEWLGDTP